MFGKLTLSGYRGKIGDGFDLIKISDLSSAFSVMVGEGKKIAVGMDKKISSQMIKSCIISSLLSCGVNIYDVGIISTANLQLLIKEKNLNAGIMIGGFGDETQNGIRFFNQNGLQLTENEMQSLLNIYHLKKYVFSKWDKLGSIVAVKDALEIYFERLKNVFPEIKMISDKKIKVKVTGLCDVVKEYFKIGAKKTGFEIVKKGENILFEINTDGAISMIKIKNKKISSEKIFPLIVNLLSDKCKKVITNFSSSFALKEIGKINVIETKTGMENISEKVLNEMADFGGEGCGSVLFPKFIYGYDAFATCVFILTHIAQGKDILNIINSMPGYFYYKNMINIEPYKINNIMINLRNYLSKKYKIIKADCIKIIDKNFWITIRPSNTEDVIRVIAQAKEKKKIISITRDIENNIKKFME